MTNDSVDRVANAIALIIGSIIVIALVFIFYA